MARGPRHRGGSRPPPPVTVEDAAALVRRYAVQLFDKGDGRAADWPVLAQLLFKAAFGVADELPGDDRMRQVLRRADAGIYNRLAGNGDDGLPSPVEPARPDGQAEPCPGPVPQPEPKHR